MRSGRARCAVLTTLRLLADVAKQNAKYAEAVHAVTRQMKKQHGEARCAFAGYGRCIECAKQRHECPEEMLTVETEEVTVEAQAKAA